MWKSLSQDLRLSLPPCQDYDPSHRDECGDPVRRSSVAGSLEARAQGGIGRARGPLRGPLQLSQAHCLLLPWPTCHCKPTWCSRLTAA